MTVIYVQQTDMCVVSGGRSSTYLNFRIRINYIKQYSDGFLKTRHCIWWLIPHQGPDGSFCIRALGELANSFHNVERLGSIVVHEAPEFSVTKIVFEPWRWNCFSSSLCPDELSIASLFRLSDERGKLDLEILLINDTFSIVVRLQC